MESSPLLQERMNAQNACVLIPTYNNATKLKAVILDVLQYTTNLLIVNDGSSDQTSQILHEFLSFQSDINI